MKPDNKVNEVYEKGVKYIKEKIPELAEKIPISFGFGVLFINLFFY